MASSLPNIIPLTFFTILSLLLPLVSSKIVITKPALTYHKGPILTGNISIAVVWYGRFGKIQKSVIRNFVSSLNKDTPSINEPRVASWWKVIESYQPAVPGKKQNKIPKIRVKVKRQVTDNAYSVGKILTQDFVPGLVQKATGGAPGFVVAIFTARDVSVQEFCMGKCSTHGIVGTGPSATVYLMVGNPETECPDDCAWPFHQSQYEPKSVSLLPPNKDIGADSMLIGFATAFAGAVTNPYNTGYYEGLETSPFEAVTACPHMFGTDSFPGNPGKVQMDPGNGGSFNAHGSRDMKFMVPSVWNPKTSSCWTPM